MSDKKKSQKADAGVAATLPSSASSSKADTYAGIQNDIEDLEFGGAIGTTALIIWSHYILYYFWYCYETKNGQMIFPLSINELSTELQTFGTVFVDRAIPSSTTWFAYFMFFFVQLILAAFIPGMTMYGLPIAPDGKKLPYHCNGFLCYYVLIALFMFIHFQFPGIFKLTHICEHYGEYLTASVLIGDLTSVWWYVYGIATTPPQESSLTGYIVYDFFMGTVLYPRIGEIDIKMIAECRWSWITLAITTYSCALKQYEDKGFVSPQMWLMVLAHWLYSNATVKGEHYIPGTWDMFHEKFGWMLNFWNISGVPYLYCFQSYYVYRNQDSLTGQSALYVSSVYICLIIGYYIFDCANCQKASYKLPGIKRNTYPQVPWGILEEPIEIIKTPRGNLLVDGFYAYARKVQYTGDIMMALSWGLICGFGSLLPYFYVLFFTTMILHRQTRDEVRCKEKYGEYWDIYTKRVPNVFIPDSRFFVDTWEYFTTGKTRIKKID